MTISEGGNRVRTTPIPSPRSRSPDSRNTTPTPSSPQTVPESVPITDAANVPCLTQSSPHSNAEPVSAMPDALSTSTRSPPSILKNAGSIPESISTSSKSPTSPTGTASPTSPTNPVDRSFSNGSKKRAGFVAASGARAKTRPSLPRRKSSQGPSSAAVEPRRSPRTPARKSPPRSPPLGQGAASPGAPPIAHPPGLPSIPCKS